MPNETLRAEKQVYDYQEIITEKDNASFLLDSYEKFGWELEEHRIFIPAHNNVQTNKSKVILKMKRNRKIVNKTELNRLQSNFEGCMREIDRMERSKTSVSTLTAVFMGTLGALVLLAAILLLLQDWFVFGIFFACLGALGCTLPVKVYREVLEQQTEKFAPLIQATYHEIDLILEKGNKLIY